MSPWIVIVGLCIVILDWVCIDKVLGYILRLADGVVCVCVT